MQTYLIRVLDPHFIHCSRKQCLDTQKHTHTPPKKEREKKGEQKNKDAVRTGMAPYHWKHQVE